MPNINIEVPEDLLRLVRIACAKHDKTQREFVNQALIVAVTGDWEVVEDSPVAFESARVAAANKIEALQEVAGKLHDSKTCRIYRCAMCVAAGKKF